jgi:hypothetical protein
LGAAWLPTEEPTGTNSKAHWATQNRQVGDLALVVAVNAGGRLLALRAEGRGGTGDQGHGDRRRRNLSLSVERGEKQLSGG